MQLDIFENKNDWFNVLKPWEQLRILIERYNIKELLYGAKQEKRVWWHLQEFGQITNLQCREFYGIGHAPKIISNLRKKLAEKNEYRIINEHHNDGVDRFGCKCNFDIYKLEEIPEWQRYYLGVKNENTAKNNE